MKTISLLIFSVLMLIPNLVQAQSNNVADKKFWIVNSFLIGATVYDVESTYFTLGKCETCHELNPVMRPFVEAGKPSLYAIQGLIDAGVIFASYKMKKQDSKFKRVWWTIPVGVTAGHLAAGTINIKIALRF